MSTRCENVLRYGSPKSVEIMMAAFNIGLANETGLTDDQLREIRAWLDAE